MQKDKNQRVSWSYKDEYVCVEAFFKYIDFNISLKRVRKEIMDYIKENVDNYSARSNNSWNLKIENIHYYFRVLCDLPLAGLKGKTSIQIEIMNKLFENSKFKNNKSKFSEEWYKQKTKKEYILKFYEPKKDKREVINIKMVRNKKITEEYLKNISYCENCLKDKTFLKISDKKMYFEVHHFIPYNEEVQKDYKINLDNFYNLVSLCPQCHRAIHLSTDRISIISKLFEKKSKSKNFMSFYGENGIKKLIENYETTYNIKEKSKIKDIDDELFDFIV